jgi:16S rRNA (guanine966-N2)-methyltransferase
MRIITGSARGTKLVTLEGEATRPTAERVKEAVFSMIQFDLADSWVLDLFAGSGQLGLEALSRGAEKAHFIDNSKDATNIIKQNAQKTHLYNRCRILTIDWAEFLRTSKGLYKYDFVFLDPPYSSGLVREALKLLPECDVLNDGARIIIEDEVEDIFGDDELASRYNVEKSNRYGRVHIKVLTLK